VTLVSGDGALVIRRWRDGVYEFSYEFAEFPTLPKMERASKCLYAAEPSNDGEEGFGEPELTTGVLYIPCGRDRISVSMTEGVVAVYRDNVLVHGGEIGDRNTVLPKHPIRILSSGGQDAAGKFNFRLDTDDRFYGMGDKTGSLRKEKRRYKMFNRDALSYDAGYSDPLYKSVPFFIKRNPRTCAVSGIFIPNPAVGEIDLGVESNFYFYITLETPPFRYILFTGETYTDILERYTWLTGRPNVPPVFTFGFFGSSMNYAESDDAEKRIEEFFARVESEELPCEGIYLSSGYVKHANGKRYTFVWNTDKFTNPRQFISTIRQRGYHIACNIKPGFLRSHPWYEEYASKGFFIQDEGGKPYLEYYWGEEASLYDFSNDEAVEEWKRQLKNRFIDYGVDGIWNDNNEFELEDPRLPIFHRRILLSYLMVKAAWEALLEMKPDTRPWIITRAGGAGIQRFSRTWTGDNVSDFASLRYNVDMGLNLGLSGIPYYGHDVGGFSGGMPTRELLLRWCESAVFQPRFVLHSWNPAGIPTEAWTYEEVFPQIRNSIYEHYRFMPEIYRVAVEASLTGKPMERSLELEYPKDTAMGYDGGVYLFGPSILVIPAIEERQLEREVYLPEGSTWYDPLLRGLREGGVRSVFQLEMDGYPRYLLRTGSFVFTSDRIGRLETAIFDPLRILCNPPHRGEKADKGGSVSASAEGLVEIEYGEDDGHRLFSPERRNLMGFRLNRAADGEGVELRFSKRREMMLSEKRRTFVFELPRGFSFDRESIETAGDKVEIELLSSRELSVCSPGIPELLRARISGDYERIQ